MKFANKYLKEMNRMRKAEEKGAQRTTNILRFLWVLNVICKRKHCRTGHTFFIINHNLI